MENINLKTQLNYDDDDDDNNGNQINEDDKPTQISINESKKRFSKTVKQEEQQKIKIKEATKKRRPKWANELSQNPSKKPKKHEMDIKPSEIFYQKQPTNNNNNNDNNKNDDANDNNNKKKKTKNNNNDANNIEINKEKEEKEEKKENEEEEEEEEEKEEDNQEENIPIEIIERFEKALNNIKNKKEFKKTWNKLLSQQNEEHKKLLIRKYSNYDKLMVDGFNLELNSISRKNTYGINRAIRLRTFRINSHRRRDYNHQKSSISIGPCIDFEHLKTNKKKLQFWNDKIDQMKYDSQKSELDSWNDKW